MKRICVYAGSCQGCKPEYVTAAKELGRLLADKGVALVYGGGKLGLMGVVADAVLEKGGTVIGVIPEAMVRWEVAHEKLSELIVVGSMHERKAKMHELSDAFIALPGGLGTLEELSEVLCWLALGFHAKPVGILNAGGYYDKLLKFLDFSLNEGFIRENHLSALLVGPGPRELMEKILAFKPGPAMTAADFKKAVRVNRRGKVSLLLVFLIILAIPTLLTFFQERNRHGADSTPQRISVPVDTGSVTSALPLELLNRVAAYKNALAEVDTVPFKKTVALLEKEKDPEKEVRIWEAISRTYTEEIEARSITDPRTRQLVFKIVLNASLMDSEDFILSAVPGSEDLDYLPDILARYRKNSSEK